MARTFNGSTQYLQMSPGAFASSAFTYGTVAGILRWTGGIDWREWCTGGGGGSDAFFFGLDASSQWRCSFNNSTDVGPGTGPTNGAWYFVAVSKATGTATPVFHIYTYSTNAWSHTNASGTNGDGSVTIADFKLGRLNSAGFEFWPGEIAAAGVFRAWVPTNDELENLGMQAGLAGWYTAASRADKAAVWVLDQDPSTVKVIDRTGGGANESAGTVPTVSTVSVPTFSYSGGGLLILPASAASGTTVSGVADSTITVTSTAVGTVVVPGVADSSVTVTSTSVGTRVVSGQAVSNITVTSTSVGTVVVPGQAVSNVTVTSTAVGTRVVSGVAASTVTVTSTADSNVALLFDSDRDTDGNFEIFSRAADGTVAQLTNNATYDSWWPRASPDGSKIVFVRSPAGTHDTDTTVNSIWTMDRDGSNVTNILPDNVDSWTVMGHPSWAPDGSKICLFGGFFDLYTCNPDGSSRTLITTGHLVTDPAYTPDGTKILYINNTSGGTVGNIFHVPPGGGTPVAVTTGSNVYFDPVADPATSGVVAFLEHSSANPSGDWNIKTININGTGLATVIADGNINSRPEWGPGSDVLYFHRNPPDTADGESGTFSLFKIDVTGSNLKGVRTASGADSSEYPALFYDAAGVVAGQAASSITVTSTAVGTRVVSGQAASTITVTSTAVGTPVVPGVADSAVTVTSTAVGTRVVLGQAASSITVTSTAVGTVVVPGVADSTITATSTAVGTRVVSGVAASSITVTSTAVGTLEGQVAGVADSTITVTSTAVGTRVVGGVAASTITVTSTAVGTVSGAVTGVADSTINVTSTAVGTRVVGGVAASSITVTSTAVGSAPSTISGTAESTITVTSTAVGTRIVGNVDTGADTARGWNGYRALMLQAAAEREAALLRAPVACPVCGEPLEHRGGVAHCPLGHYTDPPVPPPTPGQGGGRDWGGLRAALS